MLSVISWKFGRTQKSCANTAFLILPNFHSCFYNSIETQYLFSVSWLKIIAGCINIFKLITGEIQYHSNISLLITVFVSEIFWVQEMIQERSLLTLIIIIVKLCDGCIHWSQSKSSGLESRRHWIYFNYRLPENLKRNRYTDVLCLEETRVKLFDPDGDTVSLNFNGAKHLIQEK